MGRLKFTALATFSALALLSHAVFAGETLRIGKTMSAGAFNYGLRVKYSLAVSDLYPVDLDNDGNEEIIFAGFESQLNTPEKYDNTFVRIYGWTNGKLVNQTAKWLPGETAYVEGVGDVAIGDFNGDGLMDFFTTAYTDMDFPAYEYSFINKGGYFEKVQHAANFWEHGSTVADLNHDGFDDVVVTGYRTAPYLLGSANGLVRFEPFESYHFGSDIAAGHFLSAGEWSFLETDSSPPVASNSDTVLWSMKEKEDDKYAFEYVASAPQTAMGQASHDVRAIPFKLDNDELDDALVFSRQWGQGDKWPSNTRVQLLLNKGGGQFEDVTSTNLIGYQTNNHAPYHPIVVDINSDGLLDVFLSGSDWVRPANSTAFLMGRGSGFLAERFRREISGRLGFGSVSTLVKTNAGYFLVWQKQDPDRGPTMAKVRVKYATISVK